MNVCHCVTECVTAWHTCANSGSDSLECIGVNANNMFVQTERHGS